MITHVSVLPRSAPAMRLLMKASVSFIRLFLPTHGLHHGARSALVQLLLEPLAQFYAEYPFCPSPMQGDPNFGVNVCIRKVHEANE